MDISADGVWPFTGWEGWWEAGEIRVVVDARLISQLFPPERLGLPKDIDVVFKPLFVATGFAKRKERSVTCSETQNKPGGSISQVRFHKVLIMPIPAQSSYSLTFVPLVRS